MHGKRPLGWGVELVCPQGSLSVFSQVSIDVELLVGFDDHSAEHGIALSQHIEEFAACELGEDDPALLYALDRERDDVQCWPGQAVYGSDERLDPLVRETRRGLEQRRHRPT
jgi:hypothetical protein